MNSGNVFTSTSPWIVNTGIGTSSAHTITYITDSGIEASVKAAVKSDTKEIGASLYLKYVKSKLGKIQLEKAKRRLAKLQKLVLYSKEMGQRALYEELSNEVAILVREAEIVSYGIDRFVDEQHINKFKSLVKDKVIKWEPLEKFPRVVPKNVQTKIKALKKANIFDEYHILFIDYTKQDLKTTKEKIRNKDPILFGRLSHQKERYYFIADWVDEYCDLTLDKFIEKFKDEDPEFGVDVVPDITKKRWDDIVKEVKARVDRLDNTNRDNFKQLMAEEDKEVRKTKWWRRLLKKEK